MLWDFPQFWCIVGWSLSCPAWGFHINYATNFQFIPGSEETKCKILLLWVECTARGGKGIWSCSAQGTMGTIGIFNQCCTNRIHEWKASANNCALSWVSWLGCRMQAPLGEHCKTEVVEPLSPLTQLSNNQSSSQCKLPFASVSSIFPPLWQNLYWCRRQASKSEYQINKVWSLDPILMILPSKLGLHEQVFLSARGAQKFKSNPLDVNMLLWKLESNGTGTDPRVFCCFVSGVASIWQASIDGLNKCIGKDESPGKERMCNLVYVDHHSSRLWRPILQLIFKA